jgi:mRNA interferase MazF
LVVSDGVRGGLLLWVVMITSAENRPWPGDVDLRADLQVSGLPAPSVARPVKIATIEAAAASHLGRVSDTTRLAVMKQIREQLKSSA